MFMSADPITALYLLTSCTHMFMSADPITALYRTPGTPSIPTLSTGLRTYHIHKHQPYFLAQGNEVRTVCITALKCFEPATIVLVLVSTSCWFVLVRGPVVC